MGKILKIIFLFIICVIYVYGFIKETYMNWKYGHNDELKLVKDKNNRTQSKGENK